MSNLSQSFVASIACALNSAQVPCVLWGHYLLNVYGVPSIIGVGVEIVASYLCHLIISLSRGTTPAMADATATSV